MNNECYGGISILYRSHLIVLFSRKIALCKSEIVTCRITHKSNSNARIIIIYRPPSLSLTHFITDLYDFIVPHDVVHISH